MASSFGKRSGRAGAITLGIFAALVIGGCTAATTDKDIRYISGAELARVVADAAKDGNPSRVVLLDPRPKSEFEAEHIVGAWHLTLPMVPVGRSPEAVLNNFESIVVYGNDPGSATAKGMSKRLIANGYSPDILLFSGGLLEWKSQGGAVEKGPDTRTVGPR